MQADPIAAAQVDATQLDLTQAPTAPTGASTIRVVGRDNVARDVPVAIGRALMPQLRPLRVGIVGLCNGNMACGTCHVYVEESRLNELSPPDEDEQEMLDELPLKQHNSRLSCQIIFTPNLDGLSLTVAARA